jgi:hypothetical protein
MVEIRWTEKNGRARRRRANLEDISPSGAGLLVEHPVPLMTNVRIRHESGELTGTVRYCTVRENEYLVGTWNFRHIANVRICREVEGILSNHGYTKTTICTPEELI